MHNIIDLDRYPLDKPKSSCWSELVKGCKSGLQKDGLFNLPGFMREDAVAKAITEMKPKLLSEAFIHARQHNIYFKKSITDLPSDHDALQEFETSN